MSSRSVPRAREISSQSFQAGSPSVRRARIYVVGLSFADLASLRQRAEEVGEDDAPSLKDGVQLFEGAGYALGKGAVSFPAFGDGHLLSFRGRWYK